MTKIAVVGNCQAQAIEAIIAMHTGCTVLRIPPVFQLSENDRDHIGTILADADVIFAQRVSDDYAVDYIRTSALKQRYGRVLSWPVLYFSGYFPDIEYIYLHGIGKLVGPLDDYHMRGVVDAYCAGMSVSNCVALYEPDPFATRFPDPVAASLAELRSREAGVDVPISDYVDAHVRTTKLFYTVNHPTNQMLFEMTARLMRAAGIPFSPGAHHPYALARINIPVYPAVRAKHGLQALPEGSFVGIGRFNVAADPAAAATRVFQDLPEVVQSFYRFYESVPSLTRKAA